MVDWAQALRQEGRDLILCGINIARTDVDVHPRERKPGIIGQRDEERVLFEALLNQSLIDVTRTLDPHNHELFTWWPPWRDMAGRATAALSTDPKIASPTNGSPSKVNRA